MIGNCERKFKAWVDQSTKNTILRKATKQAKTKHLKETKNKNSYKENIGSQFYGLIFLIIWFFRQRNLDKALLFARNQVFCLKNWKIWRAPATIDFNIFCWNFAHVSYLPMSTKGCSRLFLFYLELELFAKIKKDLVSTHSQKPGFPITQNLNKIKNPEHTFVDIGK